VFCGSCVVFCGPCGVSCVVCVVLCVISCFVGHVVLCDGVSFM
jgi:hypothetical protein